MTGGYEILLDGFRGLARHKLRIALTTMGIVFGVGAVIAMMAIGEGAKQEALKMIEILGVDNVIVQARTDFDDDEIRDNQRVSPWLTAEEAEIIAKIVPGVVATSPMSTIPVEALFPRFEGVFRLVGSSPSLEQAANLDMVSGRFFTEEQMKSSARVAVVGQSLAKQLFGRVDVVGRQLRADLRWFTIVGVATQARIGEDEQPGEIDGYEPNNANLDIYIPLSAALARFPRHHLDPEVNEILVRLAPGTNTVASTDVLRRLLQRRHRGIEDYRIVVPLDLLRQSEETQELFNLVMALIAGISLLVGGIGIMNIMLASVLERTREIGIRRALGATQSQILQLFLIEAILICLIGALFGVAMGYLISEVISRSTGWNTQISSLSIALSVGISVGIGLIFGIVPARQAALLDPIEALRHDM